jgi:hypothetical protein
VYMQKTRSESAKVLNHAFSLSACLAAEETPFAHGQ